MDFHFRLVKFNAILFIAILFNLLFGYYAIEINICSGVSDKIFLPYLGDCSKYYICMNSTAIERECDDGYLFDAKTQSCTHPDEVKCIPSCTSALSSFCYDRTCTKYVLCYSGIPIIRQCTDGLQYNVETDRCDFPQYVDCVDNMCTIFNDPNNITFLSSKASCEKYYICMDGHSHNQTCSYGLYFNSNCNCCDYPKNVNCSINAMKRNIVPFAKSPLKRADIDCPTNGIQFLPHIRAEQYYFCLNGRGIILECSPGLVFDRKYETCREPNNVGMPVH